MPTKQSFLYVFDRVTGQSVWPIEERPVPQSDVPGESTSPRQPHPTKPPAFSRNVLKVPDDLIDFTPEMRAQALEILKRYKNGPLFNPAIVGNVNGLRGAIQFGTTGGGANWPGGSYDPEMHIFYVAAANSSVSAISVAPPPSGFSDMRYVLGVEGRPFRFSGAAGFGNAADFEAVQRPPTSPAAGAGRDGQSVGAGASLLAAAPGGAAGDSLNVQGLPLAKPPYGVVTAIDLNRGDILWQVPHGDTPDNVRNHPALKGMAVPKTGQNGSVGTMVTKTLVIAGDNQVTTMPNRPRGAMLRAYDKATGQEVGAVWMPAPQSGNPMTYMVDGKQYIVVAVSGGNYSGEYIAFSLPESEIAPSQSRQ